MGGTNTERITGEFLPLQDMRSKMAVNKIVKAISGGRQFSIDFLHERRVTGDAKQISTTRSGTKTTMFPHGAKSMQLERQMVFEIVDVGRIHRQVLDLGRWLL